VTTPQPNPTPKDPAKVRLTWPGETTARIDAPAAGTARPADPRPVREVDGTVEPALRAAPVVGLDVEGSSSLRRTLVDAYDRLADRLAQRLRSVQDDLDADLLDVRTEISALRQAVEDVGDRVEMRQLRAAIDELRSDVVGLRRAVLEWPELERVSAEITALRADMTELLAQRSTPDASSGPAPKLQLQQLAPLMEEISAIRGALESRPAVRSRGAGASDEVLEELAGLRNEMKALRRRITLRAPADDA
jgi:chromosome segregation ATPase